MNRTVATQHVADARRPIRIGFVPLVDCAPLVMAQELNLFRQYGLRVSLHRELGWATIRDKIVYGELDAAHAPAGLSIVTTLGIGSAQAECLTAIVLSLNGNAITLSNPLWKEGVRTAADLREFADRRGPLAPLTFGVVSLYSSHYCLLRNWLLAGGIRPERDVRIVVVPPPQMVANIKAGHLDGFCAGEPWNSVAVQTRVGWCAAASAELQPDHPEKVLVVRRTWAEAHAREHLALVAALHDACAFCDKAENRGLVAERLAHPTWIGAPVQTLRRSLQGPFDFGHGIERTVDDFTVFHRGDANAPSADKAAWVLAGLRSVAPAIKRSALNPALVRNVFRMDLYEEALRLKSTASHYEIESHLSA